MEEEGCVAFSRPVGTLRASRASMTFSEAQHSPGRKQWSLECPRGVQNNREGFPTTKDFSAERKADRHRPLWTDDWKTSRGQKQEGWSLLSPLHHPQNSNTTLMKSVLGKTSKLTVI